MCFASFDSLYSWLPVTEHVGYVKYAEAVAHLVNRGWWPPCFVGQTVNLQSMELQGIQG